MNIITLGIGPSSTVAQFTLFGLSVSSIAGVTFTTISGEGMYAPSISGSGQLTNTISGEGQV